MINLQEAKEKIEQLFEDFKLEEQGFKYFILIENPHEEIIKYLKEHPNDLSPDMIEFKNSPEFNQVSNDFQLLFAVQYPMLHLKFKKIFIKGQYSKDRFSIVIMTDIDDWDLHTKFRNKAEFISQDTCGNNDLRNDMNFNDITLDILIDKVKIAIESLIEVKSILEVRNK